MRRRGRPFLEPVDDAVRDALRRAREKRDENRARLTLYPAAPLEVRAAPIDAPRHGRSR